MTFALRAGILGDLAADFGLSDMELGWVNSMAFYGFPIAMMVGGAIYNNVGPKTLLWIAFGAHLLGLVLTMTAGGFWGLMISTFLIGFANGSVEAACNPLIADMYPDKQGAMLNKFHVWFPGGIVIGSVLAFVLGDTVSWQFLIGIMLVPTAIYGFLMLGQSFPKSINLSNDTGRNFASIFTPLFLVIALLMTVTATTEFGATQWVERILGSAGANPMVLLAMTAGIMASGRYFAGPLIQKLNTTGVLLGSAVLACVGLFMLSTFTGPMVYVSTAVFALGICYFWPNMIGFTGREPARHGRPGDVTGWRRGHARRRYLEPHHRRLDRQRPPGSARRRPLRRSRRTGYRAGRPGQHRSLPPRADLCFHRFILLYEEAALG